MSRRYPIQKLCIVPSSSEDTQVLAASGPTINSVSFPSGKLLYQWPTQQDDSSNDENYEEQSNGPNKRRKLDANGHHPISRQQSEASDASIEIVAERKKGERKKSKLIDTKLPNVSHLLTTRDGKYLIAVTSEDKAVKLFQTRPSGKLVLLSSRSLPKKLCALRLTKDESTILVADKFGDVYALPLHQSKDWVAKEMTKSEATFRPSATELTVHTKGNLEALRQQQVHKANQARKEGLEFEHQLLLGHVSLLTDLAVAEAPVKGKLRSFILSADRDEHIRVSRGIPQAHIIETFCHGHRDFVTKLCIPPSMPQLLISGSGEPSLRVFEWQTGRELQNISLSALLHQNFRLPDSRASDKLAVSGIWFLEILKTFDLEGARKSIIIVAIEGTPLLLTYMLTSAGLETCHQIELKGNVLDIAILDSRNQILVSIDNVHVPYSMKTYRDTEQPQLGPLQLLGLSMVEKQDVTHHDLSWTVLDGNFDTALLTESLPETPHLATESASTNRFYERLFSSLGEFLYGLENLRKKHDATVEDEAAEEVMDPDEAEDPKPDEIDGS